MRKMYVYSFMMAAACTSGELVADEPTDTDTVDTSSSDTDTDPVETIDISDTGLVGILTYVSEYPTLGAVCDFDVSFELSDYTGDCDDCDFAWALDSTISRDDSLGGCATSFRFMFREPAYLGLSPQWDSLESIYLSFDKTRDDGEITNLWRTDFNYTLFGYDYNYSQWLDFEQNGLDGGDWEVSLDGNELSMSVTDPAATTSFPVDWGCYDVPPSVLGSGEKVGATATGSISCEDTPLADTYTFMSTGGVIKVSVDTLDASRYFEPALILLGPHDCMFSSVEGGVPCTSELGTDEQTCPSVEYGSEVEEAESGMYRVLVRSKGDCADTGTSPSGDYTLYVSTTDHLTLESDDLPIMEDGELTVNATFYLNEGFDTDYSDSDTD